LVRYWGCGVGLATLQVLLVDATDGPMPQTKFVLGKALARGLMPLVVMNKVDRESARTFEVEDEILELFMELGVGGPVCFVMQLCIFRLLPSRYLQGCGYNDVITASQLQLRNNTGSTPFATPVFPVTHLTSNIPVVGFASSLAAART
jgi:hypothetical protein